ncbi:FGGY-family carbohydrate kinase [Paenibacillus sp. MABNR03]|uniref:FGGY-family carbohydrate kinase n=1 Tax=Paenibacillus sp. MABNR03 TaxID=3142626 RepID=UPI003D2A5CE0
MDLIGLDIGSTGAKCIITNSDGNVMAQAYEEYSMESPISGYFELNPQIVWEAVQSIMHSVIREYNKRSTHLAGISISSFGEAAVLIDKEGRELGNSLLYIDSRGNEQLKAFIKKIEADEIIHKTGLKPHSMYTLSKLMWYREEQPDIYAKIHTFLPFGSYILYKLGAGPILDYSLASRTMAFDVRRLQWDEHIIEVAGLHKRIFPEIAALGTVVGQISLEAAQNFGLPSDFKLVLGGHDQVCAAIGAGITEKGSAVDGIGTVECITPVFSKETINQQDMASSNLALVPFIKGKYATYAFNFTGGSLLKWYRDQFGYEEKMEADLTGRSVYDIMSENVSDSPTNILVLPHFAGSGTPYMNPLAVGAVLGIDFNTTKSDLFRALMEGVTYEMRQNIECLEQAGIRIDKLRACGGGAKSDLWLQIKADIMNKTIVALDIDEAGILGTIILCGVALGEFSSYEEATRRLVKVNKTFHPQAKNRKQYDENYAKYKRLYQAVNEVMSNEAMER